MTEQAIALAASESLPQDCSDLAVLVVTYNPDLVELQNQFAALPAECLLCVVDNASLPTVQSGIQRLLDVRGHAQVQWNEENRGLAAALNQAADMARGCGARLLLLIDQDSVPLPGAVAALRLAYLDLLARQPSVACVGPNLVDVSTGLSHGFHQMRRGLWRRVYPGPAVPRYIPCHNLNGSGTLLGTDCFFALGGLNENLFIDHVDTEWAFRVLASGRQLYGVGDVKFAHGMGERGLRFWLFGWRVWPERSPLRHYYLFRNAVHLMRRAYVPGVWKFWAVIKLALTLLVVALIDARRGDQVKAMVRGVLDGIEREPYGGN